MNFRLGTEKEQLTYKNKALKYLDFFKLHQIHTCITLTQWMHISPFIFISYTILIKSQFFLRNMFKIHV